MCTVFARKSSKQLISLFLKNPASAKKHYYANRKKTLSLIFIAWLRLCRITNESTETDNNYESLIGELRWLWNSVYLCRETKALIRLSDSHNRACNITSIYGAIYNIFSTYHHGSLVLK